MRSRLMPWLAGLIVVVAALRFAAAGNASRRAFWSYLRTSWRTCAVQEPQDPMYFAVSTDGLFSWYSYCIDYNCQAAQSDRTGGRRGCKKEGGSRLR